MSGLLFLNYTVSLYLRLFLKGLQFVFMEVLLILFKCQVFYFGTNIFKHKNRDVIFFPPYMFWTVLASAKTIIY